MHQVTKILVVFCAVLSLLLAALTMAYASNADRLRAAVRSEQAQRLSAEALSNSVATQVAQARAEHEKEIESLNNERSGLNAQISSLQAERTQLRADKELAAAQAGDIRNRVEQGAATIQVQASTIKDYRDEVTSLRTAGLTASQREIELTDRLNDLTSQREVLDQTARALREQLAEAQLALQTQMSGGARASAGGGGGASGGQAFESVGPVIRGEVQEILRTEAGDELAVIRPGANAGVKENMTMHIVRGGNQFVASLVITKADPERSVGRINKLGRQVEIRPGDMVLSRLQ